MRLGKEFYIFLLLMVVASFLGNMIAWYIRDLLIMGVG